MLSTCLIAISAIVVQYPLELRPLEVNCSSDGRMAVVRGTSRNEDGASHVAVFDFINQKVAAKFVIEDQNLIRANLFNNNGLLATYGLQYGWKLWSLGQRKDNIPKGMFDVTEARFANYLAVWGKDELTVYEKGDWRKASEIRVKETDVVRYSFNGVAFMSGGQRIVAVSGNRRINIPHRTIVFDPRTRRELSDVEHVEFVPDSVIVSDERKRLVLTDVRPHPDSMEFEANLEVRRFDLSLERKLRLHGYHFLQGILPLSLGGGMVFVGMEDPGMANSVQYVTVLDDDGVIVHCWKSEFGDEGGVVDVSPQLNTIVAVDGQGVLRLFPIIDGEVAKKIRLKDGK